MKFSRVTLLALMIADVAILTLIKKMQFLPSNFAIFIEICSFAPLSLQKSCNYDPFFGTRGGFVT